MERGAIESANDRLLIDLPRKTKLKNDIDKDIQDLALTYNHTPRKYLRYQTPNQLIINEIGAAAKM